VRAGEIATSVKSITEEDIKLMYNSSEKWARPIKTGGFTDLGKDERINWGGYQRRAMMHLAYTLAFLCLLRFDEVLKIEAHYIEVVGLFDLRGEEVGEIKLTLPFRKTK
jgi:hypothetical protein